MFGGVQHHREHARSTGSRTGRGCDRGAGEALHVTVQFQVDRYV
jgi:hypothetical protein